MKLRLLLYFLAFISVFISNAHADFEQGKIVVKFKADSREFFDYLYNNRLGSIEPFKTTIGEHNAMPYVSNSLLQAVRKKYYENNFMARAAGKPFDNLKQIAIINYNSDISSTIAAQKISTFDFVEYAEPISIKKIVGVPNDSLIYRQHYLNQIQIFDAWDSDIQDSSILIGIVDTGIDYEHEDLSDKIWFNPGEIGTDVLGKDRKTNGLDDDDNGFVDDYMGWDFVSSESQYGDNDPYPGHAHGTHVGGISAATTNNVKGIAGVSKGAKLLAVKISDDNPFSTSVQNSYQGILYAAAMGADVINCSWGSGFHSEAEMEILETANSLGSVVVAAAGNDGQNIAFFPASHPLVLSVAAVSWDDEKAGFSNFHNTVDVSAPGVDIFSSVPGGSYQVMDGTSMASPVAAGITALVKAQFPEYNSLQLREHIKSSSVNIDSINPAFVGMIGRGRVNAYNVIQDFNHKAVVLDDYTIKDENSNGILERGELLNLDVQITNVLSELENARVEISFQTPYPPDKIVDEIHVGTMGVLESKSLSESFAFRLRNDIPTDYELTIELLIYDNDDYVNSEYISSVINPSFRTMDANNIAVTFNSTGNIGYNDYPSNFQGEGFRYMGNNNILYEGALMLGMPSNGNLVNVARGANQMYQDEAFNAGEAFKIINPGEKAEEEGEAYFTSYQTEVSFNVSISQKVYQFTEENKDDFILVVYDIENTSFNDYDSLFVALYFDWDIGPSGMNNRADFHGTKGFGYMQNVSMDTLPFIGVSMLSSHLLNYFAIDNDGTSPDNPGVWDGFYREEKLMMMSSGIFRKESNITDASMVIGAGPISLNNGDTTRVAFSIFAGDNISELIEHEEIARRTASDNGIASGSYYALPQTDSLISFYPNPVIENTATISLAIADGSYADIEVYNALGQKIQTLIKERFFTTGFHEEELEFDNIPSGRYYLKISTTNSRLIVPFEINK